MTQLSLWNIPEGRKLVDLAGHGRVWIAAQAFSGDDAILATGGWDNTVRLWNTTSGTPQPSYSLVTR